MRRLLPSRLATEHRQREQERRRTLLGKAILWFWFDGMPVHRLHLRRVVAGVSETSRLWPLLTVGSVFDALAVLLPASLQVPGPPSGRIFSRVRTRHRLLRILLRRLFRRRDGAVFLKMRLQPLTCSSLTLLWLPAIQRFHLRPALGGVSGTSRHCLPLSSGSTVGALDVFLPANLQAPAQRAAGYSSSRRRALGCCGWFSPSCRPCCRITAPSLLRYACSSSTVCQFYTVFPDAFADELAIETLSAEQVAWWQEIALDKRPIHGITGHVGSDAFGSYLSPARREGLALLPFLGPSFSTDGSWLGRSYYGAPHYVCPHCGASYWYQERCKHLSTKTKPVYIQCCRGGII